LTVALLVAAIVGIFVEVRAARLGVPGTHRLTLAVYAIVALYAIASLIARARRPPAQP
jgi:hypothetical protein